MGSPANESAGLQDIGLARISQGGRTEQLIGADEVDRVTDQAKSSSTAAMHTPLPRWVKNRYPSPALACQLSPAADIDRPERLGQVRVTKRLCELGPWASSGDRADSAQYRLPTTTGRHHNALLWIAFADVTLLLGLAAWHGWS
jgi:hypothetical protein